MIKRRRITSYLAHRLRPYVFENTRLNRQTRIRAGDEDIMNR